MGKKRAGYCERGGGGGKKQKGGSRSQFILEVSEVKEHYSGGPSWGGDDLDTCQGTAKRFKNVQPGGRYLGNSEERQGKAWLKKEGGPKATLVT